MVKPVAIGTARARMHSR